VPIRIGRQKPATVLAIEDKMPGGLADDSSTSLFEILCKGKIDGEVKVTGGSLCEREWIGGHLLADLPAPQYDKLEAGQFFKPHRASGMDTGRADPDFRSQPELKAIV